VQRAFNHRRREGDDRVTRGIVSEEERWEAAISTQSVEKATLRKSHSEAGQHLR